MTGSVGGAATITAIPETMRLTLKAAEPLERFMDIEYMNTNGVNIKTVRSWMSRNPLTIVLSAMARQPDD